MPVIQTPKLGYRIMRDKLADYGNLIRSADAQLQIASHANE